jgi:hypothetical protein
MGRGDHHERKQQERDKVTGGVSAATNRIAASPHAATPSDAKIERCLRQMAIGP